MEIAPFPLGIEIGDFGRSVIGTKFFTDPAIASAGHITGRKMQQATMIGGTNKLQNVCGSVNVGGERIAQIGIEIGEAGAVNDEVQLLLKAYRHFWGKAKVWASKIALDHFDL